MTDAAQVAEWGRLMADSARHEMRVIYMEQCVRAIETAAAKLGMDPETLAQRCANGEIGTLVEQSRCAHAELMNSLPHGPTMNHPTRIVAIDLDAALKPFRETT